MYLLGLGRVEALLGHSMGATAACIAAAGGMDLRKLVLIAAPISMTQITREYAAALACPSALRADMVRHLEAREGMVFERMDATYTAPENLRTNVGGA